MDVRHIRTAKGAKEAAERIAHLEKALREIAKCRHCMGTHGQRVASAAIRYSYFRSDTKGKEAGVDGG